MKKLGFTLCVFFILCSCTFDYGETMSSDIETPDLVMKNVEYVRVRSADPIARFKAEHAERYEKQGLMKLENFSFEQYSGHGEEINASGKAGNASVNINSGDILMETGVRLDIEVEDIVIETDRLEWIDGTRTLSGGEETEVRIFREDGTNFSGIGLKADARERTWEFTGSATGTYFLEDDEEETEEE